MGTQNNGRNGNDGSGVGCSAGDAGDATALLRPNPFMAAIASKQESMKISATRPYTHLNVDWTSNDDTDDGDTSCGTDGSNGWCDGGIGDGAGDAAAMLRPRPVNGR